MNFNLLDSGKMTLIIEYVYVYVCFYSTVSINIDI